jgi:RNA polymerase sigma factor (sigma-70 family)
VPLARGLAGCKRTLAAALGGDRWLAVAKKTDSSRAASRLFSEVYADRARVEGEPNSVVERYFTLRSELALANMRLVAYVARRYVHRGVAYSDLMQEGFCGLLDAIDRFDPTHQAKLSTHATWWIRQAIRRPWPPARILSAFRHGIFVNSHAVRRNTTTKLRTIPTEITSHPSPCDGSARLLAQPSRSTRSALHLCVL